MLKLVSRRIHSVKPVSLDYSQLLSASNLSVEISEAYGPSGLGILTVKNIPNYASKRSALLPLARSLALLPQSSKDSLEKKELKYQVGWSHGKENYGGQADFSKGSYYANPEVDFPLVAGEWPPNVWPSASLPPQEAAFKDLGQEMVRIGVVLAKHIDVYIQSKVPSYHPGTLSTIISSHKAHVGRLLHYFPQQGSNQDWCGWHNDHGALTGLTSSMYLDQDSGRVVSQSESQGARIGLFVRTRKGESIKVTTDAESLAFQIGETAQILSSGYLQATPHAVLTDGNLGNVSRNTFALFMEPRRHFKMECSRPENVFVQHDGIPFIGKRWKNGMTFGEFHDNTINVFN